MSRYAIVLSLFTMIAFIGCGGTDINSDDNGMDVEDPAGLEDGVVRPVGTFRLDGAMAGELTILALKTDKTYHAETMIYCVKAPCYPLVDEGTYRYTKSGNTRYIRLYGPAGEKLHRFAYRFQSDVLYLRDTDTENDWFEMYRSYDGWCGEPSDCEIQNLSQPRCPGEWTCGYDGVCAYECQTINACEAAGGECVGLAPDTCDNGIVGDATEFSCGDAIGVQCCLPKPAAPECKNQGTRSEGWYDGETGERLCWANCAGSVAVCGAGGSKSEGWYTDDGSGCDGGELVAWDDCE